MKKILICLFVTLVLFTGCTNTKKEDNRSDDIVVLFTNDIHCAIDENITLAGVSKYKQYMQSKSKYVTLIDCGDAIQGTSLGLASYGEVAVDAMNDVKYDYAVLGNHEFDFGADRLQYLLNKANAQYLNANIKYIGNKENKLENTKPYEIVIYGDKKVAYIGVTTPSTIYDSRRTNYMEDGKIVFDFTGGNNGQDLFNLVQAYVDEVKQKGADFVIVLAHLGIDEEGMDAIYSTTNLIKNTKGIDAVIDGHSHSLYTNYCTKNIEGEYVVSAQTGTGLTTLGQLIIDEDGLISVSTIYDIEDVDEDIKNNIDNYISKYSSLLDEVITDIDFSLSTTNEFGTRIVRNRETNIGDFVSDAYREYTGADIAYVNGGGIRASIEEGQVTMSDIISVNPYGNTICTVEVTGQEILDLLEYYAKDTKIQFANSNGEPIGENGSFACMSGIHFTINTSIPTSVVLDDSDNLLSVGNTRRVSDVMVEIDGEYVPIDPNKTYTLASHNYMIKQGGSGSANYLVDHNIVLDDVALDYEVLVYYVRNVLNGDLSKYKEVDNRITIK